MAIQLIDYADKTDGAPGNPGQISSADINQIKSKANAAVAFLNALSGLFTLDGNGLPVTVKNSALPDVNIFDKFSGDFVVSNGLISLAGGNQLPVPPPLTAGVVDDTADTFTGTLPNGYAATDVERTVDGGTTWVAVVSLPVTVGNNAYAIGQVGLRIKATSERQHSATLFNATAFTISSGGNPDAGFTAISTFDQLDANITQTGNSLSWAYDNTTANRFYANTTLKIANGTAFEVRFTIDPTKNTGYFGLAATGTAYSPNRMQWIRSSDTHGAMQAITGNSNYQSSPGVDMTVAVRGRIRGDGTNITEDYSLDGGVTWININTAAQPTTDLHIQGQFIAHDAVTTGGINNIIQKGMVAA